MARVAEFIRTGCFVPRLDLGLVVKDHVQQGMMDFQFAVVFDKSQFAEFVHEKADARSGRADHFRQHFLTEFSHDRLRSAFLAEICKEKEKPGKALFARIEQLVDQVLFNSTVSRQQIRHEQFSKIRLIMKGRNHGRFLQARDHAFIDCPGCCDAPRMAVETSFAKKVTGPRIATTASLPCSETTVSLILPCWT